MRLAKCLIIVFISSLILSCSLVKTSYNNAPALTIFWLDDYFSFTQSQQAALKPSLQKLHQWHRKTQLSEYASLLQNTQSSMANPQFSADEVCEKIKQIKTSIYTLQVESIPVIIELAPTLSDKQMQRFQNKLEERTKKWKAEWWQETTEDQLKVRYEKAEDFAEDVYGDLSDAQINQLKQSIAQSNTNPSITYKEILRRNEDSYQTLITLRDNKLSPQEKLQLAKAGFDRIQKSPDQTYQTYADNLAKYSCESMANLHASSNAKQKLHAKNWLESYIKQMVALQNE
jgi:Family of unknown function (DUF6279)